MISNVDNKRKISIERRRGEIQARKANLSQHGITNNPPKNEAEMRRRPQNHNPYRIARQYPDGSGIFSPLVNSTDRKILNKWEKITGKDDIIISFVSDPPNSNFYSSRVNSLTNKIESLGYDYIITHFENDRQYHQNCCYKPHYILTQLIETGKNIIWIDGDTDLKNGLSDFTSVNEEYDIGLVTYSGDINGFVASPLYIRNNPHSVDLITSWRDRCQNEIESGRCELDHDALKHSILPQKRNSVKIRLNWNPQNDLHRGGILVNVNSDVPNKHVILQKMVLVNERRPFQLTNQDFIIVQ